MHDCEQYSAHEPRKCTANLCNKDTTGTTVRCPVYICMEVSLPQRIKLYTCQCEGRQLGQSNGVDLFKEQHCMR